MENELTNTPQLNPNSEKLKLFKNTKGYNWEIQLLEIDLERLQQLNNQMIELFGETNGN